MLLAARSTNESGRPMTRRKVRTRQGSKVMYPLREVCSPACHALTSLRFKLPKAIEHTIRLPAGSAGQILLGTDVGEEYYN